jgi:hypothetical protein
LIPQHVLPQGLPPPPLPNLARDGPVHLGPGSGGPGPADAWPLAQPDMPKIVALDVKCERNLMKVHIQFDKPFYGIVFSKGKCSTIPSRNKKRNIRYFSFRLKFPKGKCCIHFLSIIFMNPVGDIFLSNLRLKQLSSLNKNAVLVTRFIYSFAASLQFPSTFLLSAVSYFSNPLMALFP